MLSSLVKVKVQKDFDGSFESFNRGQFNDAVLECIPVPECSREKLYLLLLLLAHLINRQDEVFHGFGRRSP